ncbi:hypothetical protein BDV95DRAFT_560330 [Massariosphaeria phaeospora]|uniref:Uncharacterized protein n=1 Tax=Massariosphaeria phaeospora TaxID=100035 RepID=A0A7C8MFC8_9PLEO|nr:hypothetical protein BDV95DRAFT_560330 [Massariosphaeria phaeospora]
MAAHTPGGLARRFGHREPFEPSSIPIANLQLLSLDRSSDLKIYRQSLGPSVQYRDLSLLSHDGLRAQFEFHRDRLLFYRDQEDQALGYPSPGRGSHAPPSVPTANTSTANSIHGPTPRPPQAHFLAAPPPAPGRSPLPGDVSTYPPELQQVSARNRSPKPGDVSSYPPELQQVLKSSTKPYHSSPRPGTIYQIIQEIESTYQGDSTDIIGTYDTVDEANYKAAEYFLEEYNLKYCENPKYEVMNNGTVRLEVETDGSMGGLVTVYIKSSVVDRARGGRTKR